MVTNIPMEHGLKCSKPIEIAYNKSDIGHRVVRSAKVHDFWVISINTTNNETVEIISPKINSSL
jgi:hypothetical protein